MSKHIITHWRKIFQDILWQTDIDSLSWPKGFILRAGRIAYRIAHDLSQGQLTLRAMSLVYTTLLSLVPLLALSFSVLKAFGVHNQLEPLLEKFLAPLGDKGVDVSAQIIQFVENMSVGVLGSLGLVFLVYTVVALIQKVESAFNFIWHVSSLRSLTQRLSGYLSVVMVGPMLVVTALGITASVASTALVRELVAIEPFGTLFYGLTTLLPYLLVIGAFCATYLIIPNTGVKLRSALIGGVVAGVLWETVGWGFTSFIVGSAKYTAVYSSFAILILLLVWLYLNWLVLLLGASIAFYHQNPAYQTVAGSRVKLSTRGRQALALEIFRLVGEAFRDGKKYWTQDNLAGYLNLPMESVVIVTDKLLQAGLLLRVADESPYFVPARNLDTIGIKEVLDVIAGDLEGDSAACSFISPQVQVLLHGLDVSSVEHLRGKSIRDILSSHNEG